MPVNVNQADGLAESRKRGGANVREIAPRNQDTPGKCYSASLRRPRLNVQRVKKVKPYRSLRASKKAEEDRYLRPLDARNYQEFYNSDTGDENRSEKNSHRSRSDLDQTKDHPEERSPQGWKENSSPASFCLGSPSFNKTKRQQKLRSQERKTLQQAPLTKSAAHLTNPFQRAQTNDSLVSRSELERSRDYSEERCPWTSKEKSPLEETLSSSSTIPGSVTSYYKKRRRKQQRHQREKLAQAHLIKSVDPPVSQFQSARISGSPGLRLKLRRTEDANLWRSLVAPEYDATSDSNLDNTTGSDEDNDRLNAQPVDRKSEPVTLRLSETSGSPGASVRDVCSDDDFQIKTKKKDDKNRSSFGRLKNRLEERQPQNQRGESSSLFGASLAAKSRHQPHAPKKAQRRQPGSASSTKSASSGRKRVGRARIVETPKPRLDIQVVKHKIKTPSSTPLSRFYTPLEDMSSSSS